MSKQEEIKQALAAATPGMWNKEGNEIWRRGSGYGGDYPHIHICDVASPANAALIAKAPEYMDYLLAENEQLEKRNQDLDAWATEGFEENQKLVLEVVRFRKELEEKDNQRKTLLRTMQEVHYDLRTRRFHGAGASVDTAIDLIDKWLAENKPVGQEGEGNHE